VVYELWVTNAKAVPATIEGIEVLDANNPARVVQTLSGPDLVRRVACSTRGRPKARCSAPTNRA